MNPQSTKKPISENLATQETTPLRCFTGAMIAGSMATGVYLITISIAQSFAAKPMQSDNITVLNISAAVRTLVVGICTLGTCIFGIAALGLFLLGLQLLIEQVTKKTAK